MQYTLNNVFISGLSDPRHYMPVLWSLPPADECAVGLALGRQVQPLPVRLLLLPVLRRRAQFPRPLCGPSSAKWRSTGAPHAAEAVTALLSAVALRVPFRGAGRRRRG